MVMLIVEFVVWKICILHKRKVMLRCTEEILSRNLMALEKVCVCGVIIMKIVLENILYI